MTNESSTSEGTSLLDFAIRVQKVYFPSTEFQSVILLLKMLLSHKLRLDSPGLREEFKQNFGYELMQKYGIKSGSLCEEIAYCALGQFLALIPTEEELRRQLHLADKNYLELKNAFDERLQEAQKQERERAIQEVIAMPHGTTHCDIIKALKGVKNNAV